MKMVLDEVRMIWSFKVIPKHGESNIRILIIEFRKL